jgi:ABC-type phosphate transport system permease subunit
MSSEIGLSTLQPPSASESIAPRLRRRVSSHATLTAHGEPFVWLTGGALAVAVVMIVGLLGLVIYQGIGTFWPKPLLELKLADGKNLLGEIARQESYRPDQSLLAGLRPASAAQAKHEMAAGEGWATRRLVRVGNFEITHASFQWVDDFAVVSTTRPAWALSIERLEKGPFYGDLEGLLIDGKLAAATPEEAWRRFGEIHSDVRLRWQQSVSLRKYENGAVQRAERSARLAQTQAQLDHGQDSPQYAAAVKAYKATETWGRMRSAEISAEVNRLTAENARYKLRIKPVQGAAVDIPLETIVRAYPANQLGLWGKLKVYGSRWSEFLLDDPREANSAGGFFPAIWGTIAMTFIMTLMVVPFGVLAALYLREYAKAGPITSAVRIAINNLAGVPSIVFGAFGLGFFCYGVGKYIDGGPENPWPAATWFLGLAAVAVVGVAAFFLGLAGTQDRSVIGNAWQRNLRRASILFWLVSLGVAVALVAKTPFFHGFYRAALVDSNDSTFGKGGLLWASLTLALLTVPVVIVATEESLAAVPNSMREGSYACGGSHWQTIRRIVLPRAMPGIMTGLILAMARGAGEVAPLMLVGVKKSAPELPLDTVFPYLHPDRSFMHLAYMIYDVGFQSPDSEAAKPILYTTTLLLIAIVALLSLVAVGIRRRLQRRFLTAQF